jgi:hypothetical protein
VSHKENSQPTPIKKISLKKMAVVPFRFTT